MVIEHKVKGYENFVEFLGTLDGKGKPVYVYFSGDKIDGKSWCSDCVRVDLIFEYSSSGTQNNGISNLPILQSMSFQMVEVFQSEPVVREQLKHADPESLFVYVEVGDRPTWKNPQCPFRKDSRTKLMQVPTLVRWGGPQKLAGEQCEKPELVEMLFTDED